eukprot:scaffold40109_cov31-Phaeocystis_antarctica.AAC.1
MLLKGRQKAQTVAAMAPPALGPPRPRAMHAARAPHASRAARAARHSNCTRCAHSTSVATTPARYVRVRLWLHQCESGRGGGAGAEGVCGERCAHRWSPPRPKLRR